MDLKKVLTLGFMSSEPEPAEKEGPMREAAGATVDADDHEWRRLTGDGNRDLAPMTHERMQKLAHFLWESNLIANRLIELPVAYLLSQGVTLMSDDPKAQEVLDRHWKDGINAWDLKLPKRVRELSMFGEQCWPVFVHEQSGFVRLGYLDPAQIATVVSDPDNSEQPIGIVTRANRKGERRRYRIIVNVPETAFTANTQAIRQTFTTGDCFYFRVNDLSSATRGRSDLLAQMDWLDAYDQFLFGEVDRAAALRAFIWDVKLTGATPEEVLARAASIAPPRPNSVRVHNENEEWTAEAPNLNSYDSSNAARLFRNHMLGGATFPEHWFGGAEDVNRATGDSMSEPTERMLEMRQAIIGYQLTQVGQFVLRAHWGVLDRDPSAKEQAILDAVTVQWPELTVKDTTKYAAALQQVVSAIVQVLGEGLITRVMALRMIAAAAVRLGIEIDPEAELRAADQEQLTDRDINPPADPPDDTEPGTDGDQAGDGNDE